jgi:hypothetical protein
MSDILDEAASVVECQECPWYKSCVMPMRFSPEDLSRELQKAMPGTPVDSILLNTAAMAQNTILEGCPIFVKRLKSSSRLSEQLKKTMRSWGAEEDPE